MRRVCAGSNRLLRKIAAYSSSAASVSGRSCKIKKGLVIIGFRNLDRYLVACFRHSVKTTALASVRLTRRRDPLGFDPIAIARGEIRWHTGGVLVLVPLWPPHWPREVCAVRSALPPIWPCHAMARTPPRRPRKGRARLGS